MTLSEQQKKELKACILQISATAGISLRGGTLQPLEDLVDILDRKRENIELALQELDAEFDWAHYADETFRVSNKNEALAEANNLRREVY